MTTTTTSTLPDALVVGPHKTGSTWIHAYLEARGDVCLPHQVKETWFFDRYYARGLDWYEHHFEPAGGHVKTIEASPTYFHGEDVAERVARDLGPVRVLCAFREPVARTVSMYHHMRRYGMTRLPFREAAGKHRDLIEGSRYGTHLAKWFEMVGRENVSVLWFDDLRTDPDAFASRVCESLGLEPMPVPDSLRGRVNEGAVPTSQTLAWIGWRTATALRSCGLHSIVESAKGAGLKKLFFGKPGERERDEIAEADLAWLHEKLAPEVARLEELTGADLARWKAARERPASRKS